MRRSSCPLIILDEPTSALDPLVEYEILTRFLELTRERTAVIISHRVGICRTADRIVVMKDGCAVETGTHEELLEAQGDYAKIRREQAKWYQG
ncbi:MAG: ABC transporter ATP-binding protein/permease [Lachnospiraceae bacterium]|nr:ABC transporter ATP-binding protein/permease [Lachnospiraceae bacterium]